MQQQLLEIQFFTDENHKKLWLEYLIKRETAVENTEFDIAEASPESPYEGTIIDKMKITDIIYSSDEMVNFQPYSSVPNETIKKPKQSEVVIDGYLVCESISKECFVIKPNLIYKIFKSN